MKLYKLLVSITKKMRSLKMVKVQTQTTKPIYNQRTSYSIIQSFNHSIIHSLILSFSHSIILSFSILLLISSSAMAQKEGEVEDKVVIIEKEAKLELAPANRNFEKISFEPQETKVKTNQQFAFEEVEIALPKLPAKIKVPTIPPDPLSKLYGNYLKAGIGNYATTYLEAFISSKRSDKILYGAHFKHLASAVGPVEYRDQRSISRTSENNLDGYVKYFADKVILNAGVDMRRLRYNYYGFNKELPIDKDTVKQVYNLISLYGGFENKDKTDDFNYKGGVRFNTLGDFYKARENEFLTDIKANYSLSKGQSIDVYSLFSYSNRKDTSSINRIFFIIKPGYLFVRNNLNFRVGFNAAYTNDSIKAYDKFHLYPSASVEAVIIDKLVTAFGGIDGEMQKNTLRSFVLENPFLGRNAVLYNTNKSIEFFGGIKGNVMENLNYKVRASYANYKNLYFFNNSRRDTSEFEILYARGNTGITNLLVDFSYEVSEKFRLGVNTNVFGYNLPDQTGQDSLISEAWHRPNLTASIYGTYNLYDKIYFKGDFYYISGLRGRNFITDKSKEGTSLPPIVDLNIKVNYKFSPVFSAFMEFNNIFAKKYQRYLYYPVRGINVLTGLTYSF